MISKILSTYWLRRILKHLKEKGLISLLKNTLLFLNKTFNPKYLGEFPLSHFFNKRRRNIMKFCKNELKNFDKQSIKSFFNYYLDEEKINKNSIVYSFGLSNSINFELDLIKKHNIKIFCYDPTDVSVDFFKKKKFENLIYHPYGIWIEDKKVKFHLAETGGGSIKNEFINNAIKYKELQCYTLKTLMRQNNHNTIDILKMDIEGIADKIIFQLIDEKIFPNQICAEFEVSEKENLNLEFLNLKKVIDEMKKEKYIPYHMPRFSNKPYDSIEVLFIKEN